jgi:hypothetical protein
LREIDRLTHQRADFTASPPLVDLHVPKGIYKMKLIVCLGLPAVLIAFMSFV